VRRGLGGARDRRSDRGQRVAVASPALPVALALLLVFAACDRREAPPAEPAAPPAAARPAPGALAFVEGLVGRYPREVRLFETAPLSTRLQTLLGDRTPLLAQNLEVQGPISEEKGVVYVTGNKEHAGGSDAAIVLIDVSHDALHVWLLVGGALQEYHEKPGTPPLPEDVQSLLATWSERS